MALSSGSKILVSDISNALSGKQDVLSTGTGISISSNKISNTGVTSFNGSTGAITYSAPVTSVNGMTGAVTVSSTPSTVKGVIGSAVASNSNSMTLPSGGTWFVFNSGHYGYGNTYLSTDGVGTTKNGANYTAYGNSYSGGTTVYAIMRKFETGPDASGDVLSNNGKLVAIRIS